MGTLLENDGNFRVAYRDLEQRMRALALADGDAFVPCPELEGRVHYVLICMEPSLGRWARTIEEARSKVDAGFRNFLASIEDAILRYCAHHYLCKPGERYHITDLSKGAMLVKNARYSRTERYDRWYPLLQEEIDLVATPNAGIVAVGRIVSDYLKKKGFKRDFASVIHYSGLAGRARNEAIRGQEDSFEAFRDTVSREDLIELLECALRTGRVGDEMRAWTLSELNGSQLTPSRLKLMFHYKLAFESYAARRAASVRDPWKDPSPAGSSIHP